MNFQLGKYFYGDIPDENAGGSDAGKTANISASNNKSANASDWPLWEIFIRSKQGLDHKHMGSLHAADAQMAIENARDVYTRRMEGISIWAVESKHIHASNPDDAETFYAPAEDKVYRYPTFYHLPEEAKHI